MLHISNRGFTLIETVLAISIVGMALMAISQALAFGLKHSSDGIGQARAVLLAQAYFEEISAKRFDESTPSGGVPPCATSTTACGVIGFDAGETRTSFDDIDDFDGLIDAPPRDSQGHIRLGYDSFRVSVDVRYLSAPEVSALGLDATSDAKRVSVTVTAPTSGEQEFVSVFGNF